MFGGAGLYLDGLFFALVADDVLYFKVDDSNRKDFEAADMGPFKPFPDKPTVMQYYEVPIDVLENRNILREWAQKAVRVAERKADK
jgi:DNA transformation protein